MTPTSARLNHCLSSVDLLDFLSLWSFVYSTRRVYTDRDPLNAPNARSTGTGQRCCNFCIAVLYAPLPVLHFRPVPRRVSAHIVLIKYAFRAVSQLCGSDSSVMDDASFLWELATRVVVK